MRSKLLLGALLLLVLICATVWSARAFFLQNKVKFLLNQRDFVQAGEVLKTLAGIDPENSRTRFLQGKTDTLSGKYNKAVTGHKRNGTSEYSEELYWDALALFQLGRDAEAEAAASQFILSGEMLSKNQKDIVKALAHEQHILDIPDPETQRFQMLYPVEQAIWTGLAARQQMEIGRLEDAAQLFRSAFLLGARNPGMLGQACRVNALVGYVEDAQMFFDYSGSKSVNSLLGYFLDRYKTFSMASLTLHNDDLVQGGRKIDIARALAWSAGKLLQENPAANATTVTEVVKDLLQEYPYDVVLQVRQAEIYTQLNRKADAVALYRVLLQKFPNFTVLVRLAGVEGVSDEELAQRCAAFMSGVTGVSSLSFRHEQFRDGESSSTTLHVHAGSSAISTTTVPERGNYIILLAAHASNAGNRWPLVKVLVDDGLSGTMYVCHTNWDCYSLSVPLTAGAHTLKLVVDDTSEDRNSSGTVREMFLKAAYVSLTGVADVR